MDRESYKRIKESGKVIETWQPSHL